MSKADAFSVLERFLEEVKGLKVLVVGEFIQDVFIPASYKGQSMKSSCPVFELKEGKQKEQRGGASAIRDHIAPFVEQADLLSNPEGEIVKTRYFDSMTGDKHAEINRIAPQLPEDPKVKDEGYDLVIVADFGHGFCDGLEMREGFHLMCQTNSNNFGFNRVSKWSRYRKRSVCIDLREASLQMNRKIEGMPDDRTVRELYDYELNTEDLFVTVGKEGSLYFDGDTVRRHGVFEAQEVVDTIGAGDAFFAFAALSDETSLEPDERLIVPSLAANLTTTWMGNQRTVEPETLKAHAERVLSAGIPAGS